MKKIILTEFYPTRGHQMLFDNIFRILSMNFETIAFAPKNNNKGYNELCADYYSAYSRNRYIDTYYFIKYVKRIIKQILSYAKENQINDIVCLTYDEVSLFFCYRYIPSHVNVYLMHHPNLDQISKSKIKYCMFNMYKFKFIHVVQCNFMKIYLENKYKIQSNRIFVWPHPLNTIATSDRLDIDCVGLSGSNDESLIYDMISLERNTQQIKKNNLRVILKSKLYEYDNKALTVIKGYLPRNQYDDYISRSKSLLILFPKKFSIRMSGTLMDALSNKKILIGTEIPAVVESRQKYPSLIHIFDVKTFVSTLLSLKHSALNQKDFDVFQQSHSNSQIAEIMYKNIEKEDLPAEILAKYF